MNKGKTKSSAFCVGVRGQKHRNIFSIEEVTISIAVEARKLLCQNSDSKGRPAHQLLVSLGRTQNLKEEPANLGCAAEP